jgi:hypothetical protein
MKKYFQAAASRFSGASFSGLLLHVLARSFLNAVEIKLTRYTVSRLPLPFLPTSFIISVCLDLAGRFRNKDIYLC